MKKSNSISVSQKTSRFIGLLSLLGAPLIAQVSPAGGTFADKAIITEATAGETIERSATLGGLGPALVHNFDAAAVDSSYTITPGAGATPIGLSSGRHLVLYSTRFDDNVGGTNDRSEFQTNLTLNGAALAAGRSQAFLRRTGGADEAVMSGGAIINVTTDDHVLTLETRRSDNDTETNLPIRVAGQSSIQLLRLDDSWDYLSVSRAANQAGTVGTSAVDVAYDTNDSPGTMGTAFGFTANSGDVTLNESGLYLVFANTSIQKTTNLTRTNFEQSLTLNDSVISGSRTTTYVRGNEDTNEGVTAVGRIISATAGQVLNVQVLREPTGTAGIIQGNETALSIIKLPLTAKYIEVTDTTNQDVVNPTATVVGFNTLVSPSNATFTHGGGSTVTVNTTDDYLFLGSLFTQSDATNDNHDRVTPIHGWQIDGSGGPINRGIGAAYNRDNGNSRLSGSWNATLLELTAGQTVEMTSENVGTPSDGFPNTPNMQGLSISSLIVSNDPAISVNLPPTVLPSSTGNVITSAFLDTFDNDTPASNLTYSVTTAPTGGTLLLSDGALGLGGTFTQDDIDNNLLTFDAGAVAPFAGGFDFTVSDGGATDGSSFVINVEWPVTTVTVQDDGDVTEGGVSDFIFTADVAPEGADLTVTVAYSGSASGTDFTGATTVDIPDGATTAAINITTLSDGLFEGAESVVATITDVSGATITGAIGTPSSAFFLINDGANSAPTGTNLGEVVAGTGTLPLGDIIVSDPDADFSSTVTGAGTPLFYTNGIANKTSFYDGRPEDDSSFDIDGTGAGVSEGPGMSLDIAFIPQAGDLTGVVDVWEIGGSSNGSALLLRDGIPHFLSKANGTPANVPTDDGSVAGVFTDLDWASDNTIVVPLSTTALTAGQPAQIALVFNITGGTLKSSVNGSAEATATLLNRDGTNWRGDQSVFTGTSAGTGTGGSSSGAGGAALPVPGLAEAATLKNLVNGFGGTSSVRFWSNSTGSATGTAGSLDQVTATLTISDWVAGAGDLTATSGNGETYASGIWSVTGDADTVNAALAAAEFVTDVGTVDPTVINVELEDGDEDLGGPTTGAIVITANVPDPVYVDDDFSGSIGDPIADADGGTPVSPANFGVDAFSNLAAALAAVPTTGTIIVNDGDYSTENITLADSVTLQLTDTTGPVQIGSLGASATNSIDLQSNTLEVGATAEVGVGIDAVISGTGGVTKVGAGLLVFRGVNTYTGTTAVNGGFFRVGQVSGSLQGELAGDGPVVVTDPGRLELNTAVDQTISQTGAISGTGSVGFLGDGTVIFDNPGANTFSGGFELGDGASSLFDGETGGKQGFVVVNHNDHLGTGIVHSRGAQLWAGTAGIVISNDFEIDAGGFRCGGSFGFEISGDFTNINSSTRGYSNLGLDGVDLVISGNISLPTSAANLNFEGSEGKDNGSWTVTGNITGVANVLLQNSFDNGELTLSGTNTYTGTTSIGGGIVGGTMFLNGSHTGGGNYLVNNSTLAGVGSTTSAVTINGGGTLSPGAGPGTISTGSLTINGTLEIDADNNTPGTGHDQVIVTGTATLGASSVLVIDTGAGLNPADSLVVIDNDGNGDAITGTFSGLAEGAAFDAGAFGFDATAAYGAGDGNDFVINFSGYTVIGQWRLDYYGNPGNVGAGANSAAGVNGLTNLQNLAWGLDPLVATGTLDVNAGTNSILSLGPPTAWVDPATNRIFMRHTRRADFAAVSLAINPQFSSQELTAFENNDDVGNPPTVIATGTGAGGVAIEAVQTEFPLILPTDGRKGRYGRVNVSN